MDKLSVAIKLSKRGLQTHVIKDIITALTKEKIKTIKEVAKRHKIQVEFINGQAWAVLDNEKILLK